MPDVNRPLVGRGQDQTRAIPVVSVDQDGNPTHGVGALPTAQNATDAALVQSAGVTGATVGAWVELMPADAVRSGAYIQNRSTANLFIRRATAQPPAGPGAGDIQIPPQPAAFRFDFRPLGRWWVRADAASAAFALNVW